MCQVEYAEKRSYASKAASIIFQDQHQRTFSCYCCTLSRSDRKPGISMVNFEDGDMGYATIRIVLRKRK
jgi:hypothetical protein